MILKKGTTILYTDLVFSWPRASFLILDELGWALVIENQGEDKRPVGTFTKLDWDLREWEDFGWEVISPCNQ